MRRKHNTLVVAACSPASHSFLPAEYDRATVRMIKGLERDPARIAAHVDRFLDHHARMLRRAGGAGAAVAVIPEDCLRLVGVISRHRGESFCAKAICAALARYEEVVGAICREYSMCVVGGTVTWRKGHFYNTAIMLDATGKPIASYDKTHLPRNGEHRCLTPGADLPVFDTPVGRVGFLICWDIIFPETYAVLALKGAEIIFQPTFGHWEEWSDVTARSRAHDWSVPLVVSMWGGCSCIIDQEGNMAARTGRVPDSLAVAPLRMSENRRFIYLTDTRRQKPLERRLDLYRALLRDSKE